MKKHQETGKESAHTVDLDKPIKKTVILLFHLFEAVKLSKPSPKDLVDEEFNNQQKRYLRCHVAPGEGGEDETDLDVVPV